tara:strand:- start:1440 stop:1601 length:162 start_codon:yes stop_codon:yes gene_type:complete
LVQQIETTIKNALSFKAQVLIVDADRFSKPGAAKVALTLRDLPDFLTSTAFEL